MFTKVSCSEVKAQDNLDLWETLVVLNSTLSPTTLHLNHQFSTILANQCLLQAQFLALPTLLSNLMNLSESAFVKVSVSSLPKIGPIRETMNTKVSGKTIKDMEMAGVTSTMEICMKVSGWEARDRERERHSYRRERGMLGCGKEIGDMGKGPCGEQMGRSLLGCLCTISSMAKDSYSSQMAL